MTLLDRDLGAVFGAAFGAIYSDAVLQKSAAVDDGSGGFAVAATSCPAKVMVAGLSDQSRAAAGLPQSAVTLSVLRAGLPVPPDLGDCVTVSGRTYRLIRIDTDPAGAASLGIGVPT